MGVDNPASDILFVVDNSPGMEITQDRLAEAMPAFLDALPTDADYRIAVISGDMGGEGEREGTTDAMYADAEPYHLLSEPQEDCVNLGIDHGCARGPDPALRIIDSSTISRDVQKQALARNVLLGSCGEREGIAAMGSALSQACNADFIRPDAQLVIVFVSNFDDEGSVPIETYIDDLVSLKPDPKMVRIAVIGGVVGGAPIDCSAEEGALCGGQCDRPPPMGSGQSCAMQACPAGELCGLDDQMCIDERRRFWSRTTCSDCRFFQAPDCCEALGSVRYVALARGWEARVGGPARNCAGGRGAVCLVRSVCADQLREPLQAIANELVGT